MDLSDLASFIPFRDQKVIKKAREVKKEDCTSTPILILRLDY